MAWASSRRIYFLAVNHAVPALGGAGGTDLRRLLAHAIQRDAILNECFRAGYRDFHQALNGPFPPDTWPCSPLVSPTLDQPDLARSLIDPRRKPVALELKYPADDPAVERACQMMQKQLEELKAGVTLKLKAEPPAELRRRVESENDFQLAYWHYDYPDDWFSPAGLLDPKATGLGNRNFLGYVPPPDFDAVLARCQNRRDFAEVRKAMQRLHDVFVKEMPFIPLWHLDTHLLIHAGLETVPPAGQLDPLAPFTHIERWTLK
jgi:peptide/nickel transport system substrate-binding protein